MKNHADTNHQFTESKLQSRRNMPLRRSLGSLLATIAVVLTAITLSNCAGYTSASSTGPTTASGVLSSSATTVNFGSVAVGSSALQSLSVTNTGTAAVDISQATISGTGFTVMSGTGAATLAAGQSATVQVQFAPTSAAAATGSLVVTSDASNPTLTIALSGSGAAGAISATPASVSFGNVADGTTATQAITLKNTGTTSVNVSSESVTGTGFGVTGFAAQSLAAGSTMTFNATFAPTSTAAVSGSISVVTSASATPTTIALTGAGSLPGLSVTPSSVSFGNVVDGTSSSQLVTLTNTGTANLVVSSASATGTGFSVSGFTAQTVAPSSTMTFNAVFSPTTTGAASGSISVATNLAASPTAISLSGTGTQAGISVTPSSVTFGNVADGTSSSQVVTLKNTGTANLTVSSESVTGAGFSVTGFTAQTLTPNSTMTFSAVFAPTSAGAASGSISVNTNLAGSPTAIPLTGTGTQAGISVTPSSVAFGNVADGTGSTQAITLKNTGTANLVVSSESITGAGFSVAGFTAQTLTPNSTMSFNAVFAPTSAGAVSGTITVTTNLASPTTIALTGTGAAPAMSVTPSSVAFGNVADGSNSSQTITLTNTGVVNLVVSSASATGAGFSVSGFTAQTVTPGNTMTFSAVFAPTSAGAASGSISVATNVPASPTAISLTGTGTAPAMSATPSSVTFGSVVDGQNNSQTITLKNTGTANLVVSSASATGTGFSVSGFTAQTLTPNSTMTFNAVFAPSSTGGVSGSVSVATNAPGSPTVIGLTGTGAAATYVLTATPATLNFGSVNVGSNSSLPVTLQNTGNSNITISGISGATGAFSTSGAGVGTTLTPTQSTTLNVIFTPSASGAASGTITIASNDTTPPSISVSGTGAAVSSSVSLSWSPSGSSDVVGYNVYRGTISGGPYTKITPSPVSNASDSDSSVTSGNTYYYVVTAVDSSNNESADSNQATATIP